MNIPEVSDNRLKKFSEIFPVRTKDGHKFALEHIDVKDYRDVAFTFKDTTKRVRGLKEKSRHRTLHTFGYHGIFKPSIAEVVAQVKDGEWNGVIAFETIGPDTSDDLNREKEALDAGFHVAETILYTQEPEEDRVKNPDRFQFDNMELEDRLDHTVFLVQATHNETHSYWKEYHDNPDKRFKEPPIKTWDQASGKCFTVGYFGEHPVAVQIFWNKINGQWVGFWEPTSRVVDYQMIEKWLDQNYTRKTHDGRNARCDSSNFHNCLAEILHMSKG